MREVEERRPAKTYRPRLPRTWWLRRRNYFVYVIRDLSPTAGVIWLLLLLYQVKLLGDGSAGYAPFAASWFVPVSVLCLVATLFHSVTWFRLSGVATPLRFRGRFVKGSTITIGMYALFVAASAVIALTLSWLAK